MVLAFGTQSLVWRVFSAASATISCSRINSISLISAQASSGRVMKSATWSVCSMKIAPARLFFPIQSAPLFTLAMLPEKARASLPWPVHRSLRLSRLQRDEGHEFFLARAEIRCASAIGNAEGLALKILRPNSFKRPVGEGRVRRIGACKLMYAVQVRSERID